MNELLKAYLIHTKHHLAGRGLDLYEVTIEGSEQVYEVRVENGCEYCGCEYIKINVSDLLVFLFERQGGVA